jgi:hypothetical protein
MAKLILIILVLVMGCSQHPWLTEPRGGWIHASEKYNNFFSDEVECRYLEAANFTQDSPIIPLRFGRDKFTTYEDCMERKGYAKSVDR